MPRSKRAFEPRVDRPGPRQSAERPSAGAAISPPGYGVGFADRQTSSLRPGSGGERMPSALQSRMERALGADLSTVRIHQGPKADAIGAKAYTRGSDIYFAPGQYSPHDRAGQDLLGHELVHVVQQSQGRVASVQAKGGVTINSSPSLEREADVLGSLAARGERVHVGGSARASGAGSRVGSAVDVVQPAYTAKRALGRAGKGWMLGPAYHMHIFFEDGGDPSNIGFMGDQGLGQDEWDDSIYDKVETGLDDAKMRAAVDKVGNPGKYSLLGNNCQAYVAKVMVEYNK